ncbi:MAG: CsgG/HfaB family protein, partial [Elusimicrobiota bacterium]
GTLKLDRLSAGLSYANFGGEVKSSQAGAESEKQPTVLRLGFSYLLLTDKTISLNLSIQNVADNKNADRTGMGFEWLPVKFLALRMGTLTYGHSKSPSGISFGLGINYEGFGFNYSMKSGSQVSDTFNVQTIDFSYKFGKERAEEPTVEEKPEEKPAAVPVKEPEKREEIKPPAQKMNLAIADFQAKNVSAADASIVADFLRTELVNIGYFNVIEKANMDKILAEAAFQQTGCTTSECAVQMGKLLNVQKMVVGSLSKLMDTYYITVNLVDVETGKIIKSHDQDAMSAKELKNACAILAQKLSK